MFSCEDSLMASMFPWLLTFYHNTMVFLFLEVMNYIFLQAYTIFTLIYFNLFGQNCEV